MMFDGLHIRIEDYDAQVYRALQTTMHTAGSVVYLVAVPENTSSRNFLSDRNFNFAQRIASIARKIRICRSSEEERSMIRQYNLKATSDGIETCETGHQTILKRLRHVPHFRARFNRRIPCWRSNRWKSLT